ncbi:MAG: DUF2480 family protein [Saprospiraceae bacterium]|nr:DUF2480 family protein [Saprospiraceae bacterium]
MNKDKPLVNRVAKSGIVTINLEDYFPQNEILEFDITDYLFKGLILREKDFRASLDEHDWTQYKDKNLAVHCSADAIVPIWAFQLVTINASEYAKNISYGNVKDFLIAYYYQRLQALEMEQFKDKRCVIKGCGNLPVPISAYTEIVRLLVPVAKKIMYGEPCSMVPIYKK